MRKFGAGVLLFLQFAIQLCGLNLWWGCFQTSKVLWQVLVLFVVLQIADSSLTVGFFVVVFVVCNFRSCFTVGFVVVVFVLLQSAEACFVSFGVVELVDLQTSVQLCSFCELVVVLFANCSSRAFAGFGGTAICGGSFANCRSWCFGGFVVTAGVCLLQTIITTILQKS